MRLTLEPAGRRGSCKRRLSLFRLFLHTPPNPHTSLVHDIIGKHSDLMAMFNEFLMRCEVGPDDPYTRQYPRDRNRVRIREGGGHGPRLPAGQAAARLRRGRSFGVCWLPAWGRTLRVWS